MLGESYVASGADGGWRRGRWLGATASDHGLPRKRSIIARDATRSSGSEEAKKVRKMERILSFFHRLRMNVRMRTNIHVLEHGKLKTMGRR